MNPYTDVLFEEVMGKGGDLGLITLNRPNVLNALNDTMINAMHDQLKRWAIAPHIKAVIIRATGRAFSAGGDLRLMYQADQIKEPLLSRFFYDEYQLNRCIFHFPKPYIALLDGITMGGGVGISIHGSHRIATNNLVFAMPETGIGFFPDVGGTYFLPRLTGHIGFYLGLAGVKLTSDDCVALGIVQFKVNANLFAELIDQLAMRTFADDANSSVTQIINDFALSSAPTSTLMVQEPLINKIFSHGSIEKILQALQTSSDPFCHETLTILNKKSPTSLKVTLRALQLGKQLDFDACMRQEYRMTCRFLKEHDFFEGIRAMIIDKDQTPRWMPSELNDVNESLIEAYFAPVAEELE